MDKIISKLHLIALALVLLVFGVDGEIQFPHSQQRRPFLDLISYRVDLDTVSEKWAWQRLDHFDSTNYQRWSQRFLENNQNYQKGGPIFIFLGGNWKIQSSLIQMGHFYDIAVENKAVLYYLEQRYYGLSHPTWNTSFHNLQYLTIEQTLSDTANFIDQIKANNSDLAAAKVIVAGATISGSYAVWLRQKYTEHVSGVWASSAPLEIKAEFPEFKELIGHAIRKVGGDACYDRIADAFHRLHFYLHRNSELIDKEFQLCDHLNYRHGKVIWNLFNTLANYMAVAVEYDGLGFNIRDVCEFLTSGRFESGFSAYGALVREILGTKCLDASYIRLVNKLKDVSWSTMDRQWLYQSCNEVGWFPTSSSDNQPFGVYSLSSPWFYYNLCTDIFGKNFTSDLVHFNSKWTNNLYGGLEPKVTNVYFTQGGLDPIRSVGIQRDYCKESPAVVVPGYSANKDLYSASASDTLEMVLSKKRIRVLIKKWLDN